MDGKTNGICYGQNNKKSEVDKSAIECNKAAVRDQDNIENRGYVT